MKTSNNNFNENVNPVNNHSNAHGDGGRMTSIEIAELTGKQHKDLMKAIRNMEPAWEKVNGRKFALVEYHDKKGERRPCYSLTKEECLYIATHQGRGYVHSYTTYYTSSHDGYIRTQLFTRWTQLGRHFLYERLRQEGIHPNTQEAPRQIVKLLSKKEN